MIDSYVTVHFTDIEILHKNFFLDSVWDRKIAFYLMS